VERRGVVNAAKLRVFAFDGALLGAFMLSACVAVTLVEHPSSPLAVVVTPGLARRAVVGVAMGLTALGLIYSPWDKRSGAFMNPAMTLCFVRLGKLTPRDALGYVLAQFLGGVLGVGAARAVLGSTLEDPAVNFVVTAPGVYGHCKIHGKECHQGVFARSLYAGQRIPLAGVAHQNGTLRFGNDPKSSALDRDCRSHEVENLYVVDGSFFPSSAAVNPALTIMATRCAWVTASSNACANAACRRRRRPKAAAAQNTQ
jgi:choline dehydrogenase-like flavoprotein